MIAIILSAGTGTRLMPLTKEIPKPLLNIGGTTLLERTISDCILNGIEQFIIVVGHKKERVIEEIDYIRNKYDVSIRDVENPEYASTNTSVSVNLATNLLFDDILIINGDNVLDRNIIKNIVETEGTSLVIDNVKDLNQESFKIAIDDNKIKGIGKELPVDSSSGEFIGVSKVSNKDLNEFNNILEDLINENSQNYYDLAYKELNNVTKINFSYTNGLKWTEIDDKNDYEYAKELIRELDGVK